MSKRYVLVEVPWEDSWTDCAAMMKRTLGGAETGVRTADVSDLISNEDPAAPPGLNEQQTAYFRWGWNRQGEDQLKRLS